MALKVEGLEEEMKEFDQDEETAGKEGGPRAKRRLSLSAQVQKREQKQKKEEDTPVDKKDKEKKKKDKKDDIDKRRKEADFRSGQRKLLIIMMKQILRSAQQGRELINITCEVMIIKTESNEHKAIKMQLIAYSKMVYEKNKKVHRSSTAWAASWTLWSIVD